MQNKIVSTAAAVIALAIMAAVITVVVQIGRQKNISPQPFTTNTNQETKQTALATIDWVQPIRLVIDQACLSRDSNGLVIGLPSSCSDWGHVEMPSGLPIQLLPHDKDVSTVDVVFGGARPGEILTLPSYVNENPEWFSINISGTGTNGGLLIEDNGGHESYPTFYVLNAGAWQSVDFWEILKSQFPDTIKPPFSVESYEYTGNRLLVTEQNYCCDSAYTTSSTERSNYRMQYIIQISEPVPDQSGLDFDVLEVKKIPR